jgi:hypothetical protein
MRRKAVAVFAGAVGLIALAAGSASAVGPDGWGDLGERPPAGSGFPSLSGQRVDSMNTDSGKLIVGGVFDGINQAPGVTPDDDHIAIYDGRTWSTLGAGSGDIGSAASTIDALEYKDGKIYAGGTFLDAGPSDADALAVWDTNNPGAGWQPPCGSATAFTSNVYSLLIDGNTLYVGGSFDNAGGNPVADGVVACDLTTGAITPMTDDNEDVGGNVNAIVKAPNGNIYLGGNFINVNVDDQPANTAADFVAQYNGGTSWSPLGATAAMDTVGVSALAVDSSSNLYVGTEDLNVAGIPEADCIARWDGAVWSAVGSNGHGDGYLPPNNTQTNCYGGPQALVTTPSGDGLFIYVFGNYFNAGRTNELDPNTGHPLADEVTVFSTSSGFWFPVGSNGAGNGAFGAPSGCNLCHGIAIFHDKLHVGGNFVDAGGDPLADSIACSPLPGHATPCIESAPVVTPPSPPPAGPSSTGQRAAALKKCKKKRTKQARTKCKKKANQLPV